MTVTGHTTIYAGWSALCTVSFSENGQTGVTGMPQSQTVLYGQYASAPAQTPMADHKLFTGWYKEAACTNVFNFGTAITTHTTVYAGWVNAYAVTILNPNTTETIVHKVTPGSSFNISSLTSAQQNRINTEWGVVTSWYFPSDFSTNVTLPVTVNSDITLVARLRMVHDIIFDTNGEHNVLNWPSNQQVYTMQKAVVPWQTSVITTPDRIFAGWYTTPECTTAFDFENTVIIQDRTIYAKWNLRDSYTVRFDKNGGYRVEDWPDDQTVAAGQTATVPSQTPRSNHTTFMGWYTDSACTTVFDFENTPITRTKTIYARWSHHVVWFENKPSNTSDWPGYFHVAHGQKATRPAVNPTNAGSNFIGWYTTAELTTVFDFENTPITGYTQIYAKWVAKTFYKVTYKMRSYGDGSISLEMYDWWSGESLWPGFSFNFDNCPGNERRTWSDGWSYPFADGSFQPYADYHYVPPLPGGWVTEDTREARSVSFYTWVAEGERAPLPRVFMMSWGLGSSYIVLDKWEVYRPGPYPGVYHTWTETITGDTTYRIGPFSSSDW
jgi:hypothetical protein